MPLVYPWRATVIRRRLSLRRGALAPLHTTSLIPALPGFSAAGFTHSAFTLAYEACLTKTNINSNDVPPGALISFIHKGLQYLELEANIGEVSWPTQCSEHLPPCRPSVPSLHAHETRALWACGIV